MKRGRDSSGGSSGGGGGSGGGERRVMPRKGKRDQKEIIASGNSTSVRDEVSKKSGGEYGETVDDDPKENSKILLSRLDALCGLVWTHVLPVVHKHNQVFNDFKEIYDMWKEYSLSEFESEFESKSGSESKSDITKQNFIRRIDQIANNDCNKYARDDRDTTKISPILLCRLSKQYIDLYNFVINSVQSDNHYLVYRGDKWLGDQEITIGTRLNMSGFLSTSLSEDVALQFGYKTDETGSNLFEITLPPNFPIAIIGTDEYEVLLPPLLTLVVDDIAITTNTYHDTFNQIYTKVNKRFKVHVEDWEYLKTFINYEKQIKYLKTEAFRLLRQYDKHGKIKQPDVFHVINTLRRIVRHDGKKKVRTDMIRGTTTSAFKYAVTTLPGPCDIGTGRPIIFQKKPRTDSNPWRPLTYLKTQEERNEYIDKLVNVGTSRNDSMYIKEDELGNEYYWEYLVFKEGNPSCELWNSRDEFVNDIVNNAAINDITNIYGRRDKSDNHRYVVNYLPPISLDAKQEFEHIEVIIKKFPTYELLGRGHPDFIGQGIRYYIDNLNAIMSNLSATDAIPYPIALLTTKPKKQYFILSGKTRLALAELYGRPLKVLRIDVTNRCGGSAFNFKRRDKYDYGGEISRSS